MLRLTLLALVFHFISIQINAQPKKFGRVDKEDFEIELSKEDSASNAVILFDYANIKIDDDVTFRIEGQMRVKVLNSGDPNVSEFEFAFNDEKYSQEFDKIEAISFNINDKEKVEKTELKKDNIYTEEVFAGWKKMKFAVPGVRNGTIIDIRYEKILGGPEQIPNWYFDSYYPVKWSEFNIQIPVYLRFNLIQSINRDFEIRDVKESKVAIKFYFDRTATSYASTKTGSARISSPAQEFKWVMKDVPALSEEPFISSIQNYRNFIFLQYNGIEIPEYDIKNLNNDSWEAVADELLKEENIGGYISPDNWSRELAVSVYGSSIEQKDRLKNIFKYITSFSVDGSNEYFPSQNLKEVYTSGKGSRTELNLLFIKLLRSAGFEADPVFISTREEGKVMREYILPSQFNHLIARVNIGSESLLLDPSSGINSILLPENNLNGQGLLVTNFSSSWIPLSSNFRTETEIEVRAKIKANGEILGDFIIDAKGFDALYFENFFANEDRSTSNFQIFDSMSKVELDSINYEPMDFYSPEISVTGSFRIGKEDERQLDLIYLQPGGFEFLDLPRLESSSRKFPMELPFEFRNTIKFRFDIPEGYSVEELPSGKIASIPGKQFNYIDSYLELSSAVLIERKFIARDVEFEQKYYSLFKSVMNEVNSPTPTIVLKRINE